MLVLSRQKNQRINFPGLGISVEILGIQGNKVRVGVEAPMQVRVLRDEIQDFEEGAPAEKPHLIQLPQGLRHELRNTLNELGLMLHVYRKKAELNGEVASIDGGKVFEAVLSRIEGLNQHGLLSRSGAVVRGGDSPSDPRGDTLVVDDDANERELLAGFLRMCNYKVRTAADGVEALDVLQNQPLPKAIVLDMTMPRCDGVTLLRKIRAFDAWDPIHVFIVSGKSPKECGVGPSDGFTHWFQKPLDPRLIVEKMTSLERSLLPVA